MLKYVNKLCVDDNKIKIILSTIYEQNELLFKAPNALLGLDLLAPENGASTVTITTKN